MLHHHVARSRSGWPLADPVLASWLWTRLRARFPDALFCVFMSNHVHLGLPLPERAGLSAVLAQARGWDFEPVPAPKAVSGAKAFSEARYAWVNPCRARLCAQPTEWLFSTLRDSLGAVTDPWVSPERARAVFGSPPAALLRRVGGDFPASPLALPTSPPWPARPLADVVRASLIATRSSMPDLRRRSLARRVFLQLARDQGWTGATTLARVVGCCRQSVHRTWRAPAVVEEARLVLANPVLMAAHRPSLPRWAREEARHG